MPSLNSNIDETTAEAWWDNLHNLVAVTDGALLFKRHWPIRSGGDAEVSAWMHEFPLRDRQQAD